jgi:hypothetical protein
MKRLFAFVAFVMLSSLAFAHYSTVSSTNQYSPQTVPSRLANVDTTHCLCIKPLFDYLLSSGRLNIVLSDNVVVSTLINDALLAGYTIDAVNCPILQNNLNGLFYTTTPQLVTLPGFIVAPSNTPYRARIGNCLIKFSTDDGPFEHRQQSFFPMKCGVGNKILYAGMPEPGSCLKFNIQHHSGPDAMKWFIRYTDCDGYSRKTWFSPSDTQVELCAASIELIQDIDTANLVYAASVHTVNVSADTACVVASNYYRRTVATLEVEIASITRTSTHGRSFNVNVLSNPTTSEFTIQIRSTGKQQASINATDFSGRVIETLTGIGANQNVVVGKNWKRGIYYVNVQMGMESQVVKLVKM